MNRENIAKTIARQIGSMNIMAISGGRRQIPRGFVGLILPVSNGYRVEVVLTPADTYEVTRVFVRSGKRFVKGTEGAWSDNVGEVAYRASCFHNVDFGQRVSA